MWQHSKVHYTKFHIIIVIYQLEDSQIHHIPKQS